MKKPDKDYPMYAEYVQVNSFNFPPKNRLEEAFDLGKRDAADYSVETILEMLQDRDLLDNYEALGAISSRKIKEALPHLKTIVLYSDDLGLQEEAICTIRRIGGQQANDILQVLRTTEHKEFIDEIRKFPKNKL
jgi:HEAT repeat protein